MKMITLIVTITHFSETKKREEITVPEFGGGEEIRVFDQNIYHCLPVSHLDYNSIIRILSTNSC